MPLPWDSKFQAVWSDAVHALGSRYGNDPLCVYTNISGVGRVHESAFVRAQEDIDACNAKASSDGFSSCMEAWTAGAKWMTDMFHDAFPNKPFLFIGAIPSPKQDGLDALNNVIIGQQRNTLTSDLRMKVSGPVIIIRRQIRQERYRSESFRRLGILPCTNSIHP